MMAHMVTIVSSLVFFPLDLLLFDLLTGTKRKAMSIFRIMKFEVIVLGVCLPHCHEREQVRSSVCGAFPERQARGLAPRGAQRDLSYYCLSF